MPRTTLKQILLTPGPTPIPEAVALEEARPILHHRTIEFGKIFDEVLAGLKFVLKTKNDVLLFSSSGTGAMEAAAVNALSPGDEALVCVTGVFGRRWVKILKAFGVKAIALEAPLGEAASPQRLKATLKKYPRARAVFATHVDTSTGTLNPIQALGKIVHPTDALFIVDAVSGLLADPLEVDAWNIDCAVGASQKGLRCAPGVSFVSLSKKYWRASEKSRAPRFYFDLKRIKDCVSRKETPFTPPVTLLRSLAKSLRMIREEGVENILRQTAKKARAARAGLTALGLRLLSKNPTNVLSASWLPKTIDGQKLIEWISSEYGISIAGGQEELKGRILRVAHLGAITEMDILSGMAAIERGLQKFGARVKIGRGVSAYLRSLE